MIAIKKIILKVVAVISVCTIFVSTSISGFASEVEIVNFLDSEGNIAFSVPIDEFVLDDYVIPYEDYLEFYSGNDFSTYNAASGVLGFSGGLAWSADFAAKGLTCSSGGLYLLAILLCGGSIVYGVQGIFDTMANDVPEVFYTTISAIYNNASPETQAWLEEAFNLYVAGESITITPSISQDIADVINGSGMTDSAGNGIDSTIVVDPSIIGDVFDTTFPDSLPFTATDDSDPLLIEFSDVKPTESFSIGGVTISSKYEGTLSSSDNSITITNNITGASLTMPWDQFNYGRPQLFRLSKFYKVVTASYSFWTLYGSYYSSGVGKPYTPETHTKHLGNTMIFKNTGTMLDDLVIGGLVWDTLANSWRYVIGDVNSSTAITADNSFNFPLDPIGLILSNTGVGTIGGVADFPGTADPKKDKETVGIPFVPPVPWTGTPGTDTGAGSGSGSGTGTGTPGTDTGAGTGSGSTTIGVPVVDDVLSSSHVTADSAVDADVLAQDITVNIGTGQQIKDFIAGIPEFFTGLFSWLPDEFENKLDGVWVTLSVIVGLMVVVKIIDIIWP